MNSYLIGFFSNEILQNEIILSQGFSFESILRGIVGMIFLIFVAYLFSNNRKAINWKSALIGLSTQLLGNYVEFIANKRLRAIGLNPIYDISSTNNPLPWTSHWFNSRGLQNAPQETEIESYVIGGIKQDVNDDTFKGFAL